MTTKRFEDRLNRCQNTLAEQGVDALVLFPSPNLFYLTGFEEEPAERHLLAFVTPDEFAIVAPTMYAGQIMEETYIDAVDDWDDGEE